MKTIVYFHGYNSNAQTDKVERIKKLRPDCEVLAFNANVDPLIAIYEVGVAILNAIAGPDEDDLVFVGTSLGAWLASELSDQFKVKAVLINPCYDPSNSLKKYGVPEDILNKYEKMSLEDLDRKEIYVSIEDEVIDHSELMGVAPASIIRGDHRCSGNEFDTIIMSL